MLTFVHSVAMCAITLVLDLEGQRGISPPSIIVTSFYAGNTVEHDGRPPGSTAPHSGGFPS